MAPLLLQAALFAALLLTASVLDIRYRLIPNTICALIGAAGLIQFSPARLPGILTALPLLIAAMGKPDSMGGGDIKLTAAAGLVLGLGAGLSGMALGLALTLLFHGGRLLWARINRSGSAVPAALPLAPFLSLGFLSVYFINFGGTAL